MVNKYYLLTPEITITRTLQVESKVIELIMFSNTLSISIRL